MTNLCCLINPSRVCSYCPTRECKECYNKTRSANRLWWNNYICPECKKIPPGVYEVRTECQELQIKSPY